MAKLNLAEAMGLNTQATTTATKDISVSKLFSDPRNFYKVEEVGDLADSIRLQGVLQPLVVMSSQGDASGYTVLSGHRRLKAAKEAGLKVVPCRIVHPASKAEEEFILITTNATARSLSSWEIGQQAERLTETLVQLKNEGVELPSGRMRDFIAQQLNVSASKLARANAIKNKLRVPGFIDRYKREELAEEVAYEISQLPSDKQFAFLDYVINNHVTKITGKTLKAFTREISNARMGTSPLQVNDVSESDTSSIASPKMPPADKWKEELISTAKKLVNLCRQRPQSDCNGCPMQMICDESLLDEPRCWPKVDQSGWLI